MLEKLLHTFTMLGHWGYLIIFMMAFLESSAFMGMLVPGETVVVLAGILASQGYFDLGDCLVLIALGAILGDSVGYILGKAIGRGYMEKHSRFFFLKLKHIQKADVYFDRHGGKTIFIGRFVGFLRAMAPFAAGMSKMPYVRFLIYNVTGGILWAVTFTILGYFFGQSWQQIEKWYGKVGAFVLFSVVVGAGFVYFYKVLVKHHTQIITWSIEQHRAILSSRYVRGFIMRHPVLVDYIRERLSPSGYLGLHLTIGLFISTALIWIFGGITEDILTGDPLVVIDDWIKIHVLYFKTPLVTRVMSACTILGSWITIVPGSLAVIVFLALKRRFEYLSCYIMALIGGGVLVLVLKQEVYRIVSFPDYLDVLAVRLFFPSGHALMAMIFYGIISYFLVRNFSSIRFRVFLVTLAIFVVFIIGFSRIYLQLRFFSEVMAGYVAGFFWLTVCITGLEIFGRKKMIVSIQEGIDQAQEE
ncbi:MAG: bifunctional DedA family/phosphatase PAP2 family protein [Candidatus Aminicenantes bacterium]|nr:bifunctional DedA family/phosphatase PAP2 family protein [Candidatus Aminicenantes bacterium]